jgi:transposase
VQSDITTYVGLDVHKRAIAVSMVAAGAGEVREWLETNDATVARRLARRLQREAGGPVECCYEAGPTGYLLQRRLRSEGVMCTVAAPSLIPVRPGSRIKTDRRDAQKLGELLGAGLLTAVHPPSEEEEALRDLCRCRVDVVEDLLRARHRMSKFLLRRHCICKETGNNWGTRHLKWLRQLRFEDAASQATFDSYLLSIDQLSERPLQLELQLAEFGAQEPYREPVASGRSRARSPQAYACAAGRRTAWERPRSPSIPAAAPPRADPGHRAGGGGRRSATRRGHGPFSLGRPAAEDHAGCE